MRLSHVGHRLDFLPDLLWMKVVRMLNSCQDEEHDGVSPGPCKQVSKQEQPPPQLNINWHLCWHPLPRSQEQEGCGACSTLLLLPIGTAALS